MSIKVLKYSTINKKNEATGTNRTSDCDLGFFGASVLPNNCWQETIPFCISAHTYCKSSGLMHSIILQIKQSYTYSSNLIFSAFYKCIACLFLTVTSSFFM